jgi:hypothetical protein
MLGRVCTGWLCEVAVGSVIPEGVVTVVGSGRWEMMGGCAVGADS